MIRDKSNGVRCMKEDDCHMVVLQYWPILFVVAFIGLIVKMTIDSKKLNKDGDVYAE